MVLPSLSDLGSLLTPVHEMLRIEPKFSRYPFNFEDSNIAATLQSSKLPEMKPRESGYR